jgi:hypothetical protein
MSDPVTHTAVLPVAAETVLFCRWRIGAISADALVLLLRQHRRTT